MTWEKWKELGMPWPKRMLWRLLGRKIIGVDLAHGADQSVKITAYERKGILFISKIERF